MSRFYTNELGSVRNGDVITLRHVAAATAQETTETTLTMGGMMNPGNPGLVFGDTVTMVCRSESGTGDGGGGGGITLTALRPHKSHRWQ